MLGKVSAGMVYASWMSCLSLFITTRQAGSVEGGLVGRRLWEGIRGRGGKVRAGTAWRAVGEWLSGWCAMCVR